MRTFVDVKDFTQLRVFKTIFGLDGLCLVKVGLINRSLQDDILNKPTVMTNCYMQDWYNTGACQVVSCD